MWNIACIVLCNYILCSEIENIRQTSRVHEEARKTCNSVRKYT